MWAQGIVNFTVYQGILLIFQASLNEILPNILTQNKFGSNNYELAIEPDIGNNLGELGVDAFEVKWTLYEDKDNDDRVGDGDEVIGCFKMFFNIAETEYDYDMFE